MANTISHKEGMLDRPEFRELVTGYNSLATALPITFSASTTTTWDPPLLNPDDVTSINVTLTGAQIGDLALATFYGSSGYNLLISAQVILTNTVKVILFNKTGGTFNLPSNTVRVAVFRF